MIYILAGSREQAEHLALWCDLMSWEWRYVRGNNDLCGSERGSTLFLYGTWHYHSYRHIVQDTAYARDLNVVEIFDRPQKQV